MKKIIIPLLLLVLTSCNRPQVGVSDTDCKKHTPHPFAWYTYTFDINTPPREKLFVISAGPTYGKYMWPDGKTNIEGCAYEVMNKTNSGSTYSLYLMKTEEDQFFASSDKSIIGTKIQ